jgi:hypothetical protein
MTPTFDRYAKRGQRELRAIRRAAAERRIKARISAEARNVAGVGPRPKR